MTDLTVIENEMGDYECAGAIGNGGATVRNKTRRELVVKFSGATSFEMTVLPYSTLSVTVPDGTMVQMFVRQDVEVPA